MAPKTCHYDAKIWSVRKVLGTLNWQDYFSKMVNLEDNNKAIPWAKLAVKNSKLGKGMFKSEEILEISIFVPSTNRSNISLHSALLFEFSRAKVNLKVSILVVSLRKMYPDLNGLPIRELKTVSSWYFEIWNDFFTLFLLHDSVGDFEFEIEEQKKVHLFVDMTNISPPSEKNVPLSIAWRMKD